MPTWSIKALAVLPMVRAGGGPVSQFIHHFGLGSQANIEVWNIMQTIDARPGVQFQAGLEEMHNRRAVQWIGHA